MRKIEILGVGCARCVKTEEIVREAVKDLGLTEGQDFAIDKVKDPNEIAKRGVLMTPGVSVDGKIVSSGKIPAKSQVQSWIMTEDAK